MAINPIEFAQRVNDQFLNYQLTAFPITDPDLASQARELLRGRLGRSPLIKGPYVSLARSYKLGRSLRDVADAGLVHPALPGLAEYPQMFAHQDRTLVEVQADHHCLITAGTGSGKTEAFLYPILNRCLRLRDEGAPDGVVAVLVYPMNALAIDQLGRLRRMLVGSGISFGMYVGSTPANEGQLSGFIRMKPGEGQAEYERHVRRYRSHRDTIISPSEERATEAEMTDRPPRLLLTNVNQLELLLTRGKDLGMFVNAPLKYLVFDEAHTYTGVTGAEVACLIRRLRAFCGKSADEVICIGTSATLTDPETGEEGGLRFAHRFFGIDPARTVHVREEYEEEEFPSERFIPEPPQVDMVALLDRVLNALEAENEGEIREAARQLTGRDLQAGSTWQNALYDGLRENEYVHAVFRRLQRPTYLPEAVQSVAAVLGRDINRHGEQEQGELLCYLALGAAAARGDNVLLRPKVHYFLRGLEGAVVRFDPADAEGEFRATLSLSLADALEGHSIEPTACPPVLVCKTCGQHYLEGFYSDLTVGDDGLSGGEAEGDNVVWPPTDEVEGGRRVLFTNTFISEADDEEGIAAERLDRKRVEAYFCRHCGALHRHQGTCQHSKCKRVGSLVPVWVVLADERLRICPSCGQRGRSSGGRVYEPVRPLRASTVADVHILAQNMLNAVEPEEQKLIVFSDNRQDAAFQAGWMRDHARRYRMRHLMYEHLRDCTEPCSISDLQEHLAAVLTRDRDLGRLLAPEVYEGRTEDAFGKRLRDLLRYYLRIALVLEWTTSFKQRESLETWGLTRVVYAGVDADSGWVQEWKRKLNLTPEVLADGISSLLDSYRRNRYFHDDQAPVFSRYWHESDDEIQRGFLPHFDFPPKGMKELREPADNDQLVKQFRSERGQTLAMEYVAKWGVPDSQRADFIRGLWQFLTSDARVLEPVSLTGSRGRPVSGTEGVYQVAASHIGFVAQREKYRCTTCQRVHTRPAPGSACTGWQCKGRLTREEPGTDDYNIQLLDLPFSMVSAQEHSAQVPAKVRESIEADFKKPGSRTNCLVATPTLELGVDIGALDMVLMRNVPPRPSNYWQRAGRAGRRQRMAVIFTYCRRSRHDGYFFEDPPRMLDGQIESPRFNLQNQVMLRKHVHAAVLSELIRMSRGLSDGHNLSEEEQGDLAGVIRAAFPNYISAYLFEDGATFRREPYSAADVAAAVSKYRDHLVDAVSRVFVTYWPEGDQSVVAGPALESYVDDIPGPFQDVLDRLHARLMWAVETRRQLLEQEHRGLLEPHEQRLRHRCDRYLKHLAQHDLSTYALSVLATEGFLPGYGTYEGSVRAFASRAFAAAERRPDFELPRPPAIAIREFVPGNLIYANGGRFRTTLFHLPIGEGQVDPDQYLVDLVQERVTEDKPSARDQQYSGTVTPLAGLSICDVDISYVSRITDEEPMRFQLPVVTMGYLKTGHRGGAAYGLSEREVQLRRGQHVRLVNVGPGDQVRRGELGYPVCIVCGACRSPYSSSREIDRFTETHRARCGRDPQRIALSADAQVDGLLFQGLNDRAEAVNLGEALRIGGAQILEMDIEDLQVLTLPQADGSYHAFLYDPMPGGSGLLQQMLERWEELIDATAAALSECRASCERSCYECMRTYRNVFNHGLLDRRQAIELSQSLRFQPAFEREIAPVEEIQFAGRSGDPTNRGEAALAEMLQTAGFPEFDPQHRIDIGPPFNSTTPDLFHADRQGDIYVAIYLDGLSRGIHGDPDTARRDQFIRQQLEALGVDVLEIASSDLNDPEAMKLHLKRVAAKLRRRDLRDASDSRVDSLFEEEQ